MQGASSIAFPRLAPGLTCWLAFAPRVAVLDLTAGSAEIEVGDGYVARVGPATLILRRGSRGPGPRQPRVGGISRGFYAIIPLA